MFSLQWMYNRLRWKQTGSQRWRGFRERGWGGRREGGLLLALHVATAGGAQRVARTRHNQTFLCSGVRGLRKPSSHPLITDYTTERAVRRVAVMKRLHLEPEFRFSEVDSQRDYVMGKTTDI